MSTDVEDLLRDSMQRFTEGVRAPAGLAYRASRQRRRRRIVRATLACAAAAATAATVAVAMTAAGTVAQPGSSLAQARAAAYVVSRVEYALASENQVFVGSTMSHSFIDGKLVNGDQPSVSWAYQAHNRFEVLTGAGLRAGHGQRRLHPPGWLAALSGRRDRTGQWQAHRRLCHLL